VTADREATMDFTHAFYSTGIAIAVAPKDSGGLATMLAAIFTPRFGKLIAALFAMLLLIGALMWLAERRRNAQQFGGSAAHGIGAGLWWSAVTMTTVGYGDKAPVTLLGRVLGLFWMFAAILIIAISITTIPVTTIVPRTIFAVTIFVMTAFAMTMLTGTICPPARCPPVAPALIAALRFSATIAANKVVATPIAAHKIFRAPIFIARNFRSNFIAIEILARKTFLTKHLDIWILPRWPIPQNSPLRPCLLPSVFARNILQETPAPPILPPRFPGASWPQVCWLLPSRSLSGILTVTGNPPPRRNR